MPIAWNLLGLSRLMLISFIFDSGQVTLTINLLIQFINFYYLLSQSAINRLHLS